MTDLKQENSLLMNWMNVPALYRGKSFDNFDGYDRSVDSARDAIESGKGLFITGGCGAGKTHLAVSLMIEFAMAHREYAPVELPKFLPAVELFLELKQSFNSDSTEKSILDKYSKSNFLCIDDIGSEKISDWTRQSFYTLIDRRYRDMKQTIITSNMTLNKIASNIDDRVASRIAEMCVIIELNGDDFRLKTKEN